MLGNNFTAGGEELSLVVGITNKNNSALDLADLIVGVSQKVPRRGTVDSSAAMERNRTYHWAQFPLEQFAMKT